MKKQLVFAVVPFLALGCGKELEDANGDGIADGVREPDSVTVVTPAQPKGTVSGQVLGTDLRPLTEVSVEMTIGSQEEPVAVITDAKGNFEFKDVPAGAQVLLTFTKSGYAALRASSTVPSSAGNVPINNGNASFGPVLLARVNSQLRLNLRTPTGRPAAGARATLVVNRTGQVQYGPSERTFSSVVLEAQAGEDGVVVFDGVPAPLDVERLDGTYEVTVNALDTNDDGILEAAGTIVSYSGSQLATNGMVRTVSMPQAYDTGMALEIDYTNLGALRSPASTRPQDNMLRTGEAIYIAFNQPIQANSVTVGIVNEYGRSEGLSLNRALLQGNTVMSLTPSGTLAAGREYSLFVRAVTTAGNQNLSKTVAFVIGDPVNPPAINLEASARFYDSNRNSQLDYGEFVTVNFNQVMTRLGFGTGAQVFFDADLNGVSSDFTQGEWNASNRDIQGFPLGTYEPLTTNINLQADARPDLPVAPAWGYSTRFFFQYLPAPLQPPQTPAYRTFSSGTTVPLVLAFSRIPNPGSDVYESAWGVPQTANMTVSATLVAVQPSP